MIVRASIREPGDEREREQAVDHPDRARHGGRVELEEAEDEEHDERRGDDAARGAPHVARRDVAPPAVVEAGEGEDGELDRRDEAEDLPAEVALVVDGQVGVEAEPEREVPGGDDDREVCRQLRQPVAVERGFSRLRTRRRRRRAPSRRRAPAPPRRSRPRAAARGSRRRPSRSPAASRAPSRGSAAPAGGGAASRSTRRRRSRASASAARDQVALGRADDVHVVDVARLVGGQLDGVAEPELGVARRALAPRRVPAGEVRERRCGANAACSASSREFVPISSKSACRASRGSAASGAAPPASSSVQATRPPSPSANRFLVGKKLKVEQTPVVAIPVGAERLRGVLDQRQAEARRAPRAARAARTGGRA